MAKEITPFDGIYKKRFGDLPANYVKLILEIESSPSKPFQIQVTILPSTSPHRTALDVLRPVPVPRSAPRRGASATNGSGPRRADRSSNSSRDGVWW